MPRKKKVTIVNDEQDKTIRVGDVYRINKNYIDTMDGSVPDVRWRVDQIYSYHVVGTILPFGYTKSYTFSDLRDMEIIPKLPSMIMSNVDGYRRKDSEHAHEYQY